MYIYSADLTGQGTASASSSLDGSHLPSHAIDNNLATAWAGDDSGHPYWWTLDFGLNNTKIITRYTLQCRNDASWEEIPDDFVFQGSNDNSTWDDLDTQTNLTWTQGEYRIFEITNTTAYRYYRFYITSSYNSTNASIAEIEMMQYLNIYGANLSTTGTVSASSIFGSSESADKAVDYNSGTQWRGADNSFPYWWKIDLGADNEKILQRYSLANSNNSYWVFIPKDFVFQGSNNDTTWDDLDTQTNVPWGQNQYRIFDFVNTTAYRYYRFYITAAVGTPGGSQPNTAIVEIELNEVLSEEDNGNDEYCKLLCHFDGTHESTEFVDSSGSEHIISREGLAVISTTQSKFGGSSLYLSGGSTRLTIPASADFGLGTGDFTFETWILFTDLGPRTIPIFSFWDIDSNNRFIIYKDSSNYIWFECINGGTKLAHVRSLNTIAGVGTYKWHHLAIVRYNRHYTIFFNGVSLGIVWQHTATHPVNFPEKSSIARIGATQWSGPDRATYYDEIRLSKGVARFSQSFTPPTISYKAGPKANIQEELNISDDWSLQQNPDPVFTLDTVLLSDDWSLQQNPIPSFTSDIIEISDDWNIFTNPDQESFDDGLTIQDDWDIGFAFQEVNIFEDITVNDAWGINLSVIDADFGENLTIDDDWNIAEYRPINYITKIISYNPLIFITDTSPAQIVQVDITDPDNPVRSSHIIAGCKYAKDIVYNTTNEYFYVLCDEGKIVKIEKDDLTNQTIINTNEPNALKITDTLSNFLRLYVATDDSKGEIVLLDEADIKKISCDIRFNESVVRTISTQINTILGKLINCDIRFNVIVTKKISCDIRWLQYSYNAVNYNGIKPTDFQVRINNIDLVPVNDLNMKSINILHNVDEEDYKGSQATFSLNRQHDRLNFDNEGNASQITNHNNVQIYIKSRLEFEGKITNISADSQTETVMVTATGAKKSRLKNNISIPLPSVGEKLHLYHCLVNNVQIDNPDLDNVKGTTGYSKGVFVPLGEKVEQNNPIWHYFGDIGFLANRIEEGEWQPWQGFTYFWLAMFENLIDGRKQGTLSYIGTSLGSMSADAWKINGVSFRNQRRYPDIVTLLGDGIVYEEDFDDIQYILGKTSSQIWDSVRGAGYIGVDGSINWRFKEISNPVDLEMTGYTDSEKGEIYNVVKNKLGYYVGEAPYQTIPSRNGMLIPKWIMEDRINGWWYVKDEHYNYVDYAKKLAETEYEKLKTINGDVLPITSGNVDISFDAYYYYNVHLLTRLNVTNTTTPNIYNKNNGFPVSVKQISIDSSSMKVSLICDNQKSQEELDEIDRQFGIMNPLSNYEFPREELRQMIKFDPNNWSWTF